MWVLRVDMAGRAVRGNYSSGDCRGTAAMGIGNIGWTEFIVILAFALIFFGPRRLPGIANTLGKSLREFQKALNEVRSEIAQAGREADVRETARRTAPQRQNLPAGPILAADQTTTEGASGAGAAGTGEGQGPAGELTPDTATGPVATAAAMSARTAAEPAEAPPDAEGGEQNGALAEDRKRAGTQHDGEEPPEPASSSGDSDVKGAPRTPSEPEGADSPPSEGTDPEGTRS